MVPDYNYEELIKYANEHDECALCEREYDTTCLKCPHFKKMLKIWEERETEVHNEH